jgi:S-layer protein (TIGR01567 family)
MDYVRIGGVCLLLMLIAAALPVNVLAQTPQTSANGAAPIISQSLLSESKAQGETISAETLAKRNSGLKPLGTKSSSKASGGQTSGQSQTPITTSPAATSAVTATPSAASSATTGSSTATQTQSSPKASSVPAVTSSATTAAASVTPVQTAQETGAAQASPGSAAGSQSVVLPSTTVTPPDNVSPGTVISNNVTAGNVSQNGTESLPLANLSENTTQVSSSEEAANTLESKTARIWREGVNPRGLYNWTPQSFSGFFYDLKNEVGTEILTIDLPSSGRSIDSGGLTYTTNAQDTEFQFKDWGSYQVIGFMADKYFAGYDEGVVSDTNRSLISDGQLRKVLVDSDNESTLTTGSALPLEEGYELRIKQIDIKGDKVYLSLAKDGEEVDSKVVSPESSNPKSSTYKYEVDVTGEKTALILAHISNVFASAESDLVTVDGLFQISDSYTSVEDGDKYGKMKVSISDQGVEMKNEDSFSLRRDSTVNIFGNVGFQVADSNELRFAPIVQRTGVYDVRGTVIDPSTTKEFTWTPYNFEGFYYDIDNDVGTESLKATISGNRIDEKDLTYTTSPQSVNFKFRDWGKYDVIGFMADKYFAGYNQTAFADEASIINEGQLRKVLLDSDDSQTIASGSALPLQEGYELRIKQVDLNGNKVYLALAKDGKEIDSKVVTPSGEAKDRASNYMYKVDMGSEKNVPMIAAHVQSVFTSTESNLATVDAIFQVSDSPESVEEGEVHGKMKVEYLGVDGITMNNADSAISLSGGRVVDIMENLRLEVADNADRLTAPIATKAGEGSTITVTVPVAVVNRPVAISTKSGSQSLTGVQISINGSNIGTTDITGSISYTPDSTGTFSVIARKSGYLDGTSSMTVTTASEASTLAAIQEANKTLSYRLTLNAPAEVVKGENFLITVVEGINQTPVDKALISLDEENIGETSAEGTLTYSANATGDHTLKAEKEGFNSSSRKITVTSSLKVVNLTVPEIAYVSQAMKISAVVQNVGNENDSRMLELKVNDTVADSKNVTVDAGKNTTVNFSYKPTDPGLCRFSVDDITRTVNVEKAQNSNWLIALFLVLIIAGGAAYYLHTTGELDKLQKQVKKMMQGR